MAGIRMTGLSSGLDTQSLIADLSKAHKTRVDNAKKKQTKAEWKKEAWSSLNTKIFNFYKDALSTFKSSGTYNAKKVNGSLSGVKITAGNGAVTGSHSVKVLSNASAQMWTGNKIAELDDSGETVTGGTKLTDLGIAANTVIKVNDQDITVTEDMTLSGLTQEMGKKGINANFDANQGRFYLSSKTAGTEFTVSVDDDGTALQKLGLDFPEVAEGEEKMSDGYKIPSSKAMIEYNGVKYESENGTFNINGLTIEVNASGDDLPQKKSQSFVVDMDVDSIYDKVKGFVKEYNSLITEMNKLYDAPSSKGYEPLTSDEKEAMSEEEVKNWETKIKDSLLRRDSTISTLLSSMRTTLNKTVEVTGAGGTHSYGLASFGITTGTYTEKGQLHIAGNSEDSDYADQDDKLKAAIMADPDAVIKTFTTLGNEMYSNLQKAMKGTEMSSALTFYNDKQMDEEIRTYKKDVKTLQEKLQADEDKYYKQFSAMETAMAKFQSQQTYISQLFGGM